MQNSEHSKDTIYSQAQSKVKDFVFDADVVKVFDDMVERSVPLYRSVQAASANIAARFLQAEDTVYDLGCSTGTTFLHLLPLIKDPSIQCVGVDTSTEMLSTCATNLTHAGYAERVRLLQEDISSTELKGAGIVIMHYTLQFLPVEQRLDLLTRIYQALRPGGLLLLSEKVAHRHPLMSEALNELHWDFKRQQGYSEMEIAQKREALEEVLIPLTSRENETLLFDAGFSEVETYLKWYNFASIVAIKE